MNRPAARRGPRKVTNNPAPRRAAAATASNTLWHRTRCAARSSANGSGTRSNHLSKQPEEWLHENAAASTPVSTTYRKTCCKHYRKPPCGH